MKRRLYIRNIKDKIYHVQIEEGEWQHKTGEEIYNMLCSKEYIGMWVTSTITESIKDHFEQYNPDEIILLKVNRRCWRTCYV